MHCCVFQSNDASHSIAFCHTSLGFFPSVTRLPSRSFLHRVDAVRRWHRFEAQTRHLERYHILYGPLLNGARISASLAEKKNLFGITQVALLKHSFPTLVITERTLSALNNVISMIIDERDDLCCLSVHSEHEKIMVPWVMRRWV